VRWLLFLLILLLGLARILGRVLSRPNGACGTARHVENVIYEIYLFVFLFLNGWLRSLEKKKRKNE